MTRRQKMILIRWFLLAGIVCALANSAVLLLMKGIGPADPIFWIRGLIVAGGGGVLFGVYPAAILEYRREALMKQDEEEWDK